MSEQVIWGMHTGGHGAAEDLFRRRNVVAIGWHHVLLSDRQS